MKKPKKPTEEQLLEERLQAHIFKGRDLGLAIDQQERFLKAGVLLQDKQMLFAAACRECDKPDGPTAVGYGGGRGSSKALWVETPIPTMFGWKKMRELQVGDILFDETGKQCSVLGVSEVFHNHDCYEVQFDDGEVVIADSGHLWATATKAERKAINRRNPEFRAARRASRDSRAIGRRLDMIGARPILQGKNVLPAPPKWTAKSTEQISKTLTVQSGREKNHAVPVAGAIKHPEKLYEIPPYVLGAWLGDGHSATGMVTGIDEEIFAKISSLGFNVKKINNKFSRRIEGLTSLLSKAGLIHNKHIPRKYFLGSLEQRIELIRGLMDTDGTVGETGSPSFTNTNPVLAYGIKELLESCGVKATITEGRARLYGKDCGPVYQVRFMSPWKAFHLTRKSNRQKHPTRPTNFNRYIVSCKKVESVPTRCIKVSSESSLFLCSKSFIPTHNSHGVFAQMAVDDCQRVPGLKCLYLRKIGKTNREQFDDIRRKVLSKVKHNYAEQKGLLTIEGTGSQIRIGHFKDEKDIDAYLGVEYDLMVIEEATQLSFSKWKNILSCLRTSKTNWRPRVYCPTNPGGIGHGWYKQVFVIPYRNKCERETRYIQTTVHDNKYVNKEYLAYLESLVGWQRESWLNGSWDIAAGQFFVNFREKVHVLDRIDTSAARRWICGYDYGFQHFTVFLLAFQDEAGRIFVVDECGNRLKTPQENASMFFSMCARNNLHPYQIEHIAAGPDVFSRESDGTTIASQYHNLGITLSIGKIDRINGWSECLRRLGDPDNNIQPTVFFHRKCQRLVEQIPYMLHDPKRPEDVEKVDCDPEDGSGGDDFCDAWRLLLSTNPSMGVVNWLQPVQIGGYQMIGA